MYHYVVADLPEVVVSEYGQQSTSIGKRSPAIPWAVTGLWFWALRSRIGTVPFSAFSPVCAPTQVPWRRQAFPLYRGDRQAARAEYDDCALIRATPDVDLLPPIRAEQSLDDNSLEE